MIGIVVVSHSSALADAAVALASEMTDPENRPVIKVAAGLDDKTFGTDAAAVSEAISEADSGDGVLVLLDLGSAVLSAEMALEFLDPELAGRVRLSSAPLVEGLVGAAVAAGAGADLGSAAAEAEQGLTAKTQHLGHGDGGTGKGGPEEGADGAPAEPRPESVGGERTHDEHVVELAVTAPHGLHARPAARFVRTVGAHHGVEVRVCNLDTGSGPVDGRSLTGLATLDAREGHTIEVTAAGATAADLLQELSALAGTGFGDLADPALAVAQPGAATSGATTSGTATSGATTSGAGPRSGSREISRPPEKGPTFGLEAAMGPVVRGDATASLVDYRAGDVEAELRALDEAVTRSRGELADLIDRATARLGPGEAGVFDAHLAILEDPAFQNPVRDGILAGQAAPQAVLTRTTELRAQFEGLADSYQRARGEDVTSVGERLLRALGGAEADGAHGPGVLVVRELDPATAVLLDPSETLGVITLGGAATAHGVLLARARGLPVLTGAAPARDVKEGTLVALDVRSGRLVVDPDPGVRSEFEALLAERAEARDRMMAAAGEPAITLDGHHVLVKANVASVADASLAARSGADGSGLVRTEALFGDRSTAPTVAEQVAAFERIAEQLAGGTITIRTWDVGGDKPLPFHPQEPEANPFLGVRGLRAFRDDPRPLVDQLEAICRVAREQPVRVMFPMVATVDEVDWALARLDEAAGRLPDGRPDGLEVGIMIEVPAAALRPEALTTLLDFVSVGSNDLVQYTLAAERGNPALGDLADAADPAVLQLIHDTVTGVADGVQVCLCGDAASDPDLALLLVGLGVSELSAAAAAVPAVKDVLRRARLVDLQDLAARALRAESAAEVRALLQT
ncbi:phosphoenolpyruvate--protein phosphotransferase [Ornithinimicrobium sp. F0845]|uniref:phosphoenolpyruvate--protein phosphotransferase n=1 Tax=Ornithinimicrobium sp. F0845 TaxID=2926412 RepID=UPI001FF0EA1A|nr:phosphoenolpyruvate--protein phosphotransferase [Ornithinimicrobium sp. F0845]MCK0111178.1 phosphoenolpyruvate--protein phosphotransferase [Ornithinimicrobium sp. F0845]